MSARAMRVVAAAFLTASLLLPMGAAQDFTIDATADPAAVDCGKELTLSINVTNHGRSSYQNIVVVALVYPDGGKPSAGTQLQPERRISALSPDQTTSVNYTYRATSPGSFSLIIKLYRNTTESGNYLDEKELPSVFKVRSPSGDGGGGLPLAALAVAAVAIAAVAGAGAFFAMRRRPAPPPEEAEARASERPAPPVKARGKVPKDYYKFRREKYGHLKPIGLTSSGVTILGNVRRKAAEEPPGVSGERHPAAPARCPKCGLVMDPAWKVCKRCEARASIDESMVQLGKLARAGRNGSSLEGLLHSAQSELEAGNYDDARTYALDVLERAKAQLRGIEEKDSRECDAAPEAQPLPAEAPAAGEGGEGEASPAEGVGPEPAPESAGGEPAVLTPSKHVPNPCVRCGEGLKAEWKKCPYCGTVQDGVCASCGRVVKLRWGTCPHCSADLTKNRPRVECPSCGAELPDGGECRSCSARDMLESASRLVREVRGKGADVTEAEAHLGRGELAIRLKSYDKAISHFQRAEELAQSARREFWRARVGERIAAAEKALRAANERGASADDAGELIKKSLAALNEGRFKEAMSYAELASKAAEEAAPGAEESPEAKGPRVIPVKPAVVGARCPSCGAAMKPGERHCPACGREA